MLEQDRAAAAPARPKLSTRTGASRKLLERKAAEKAAELVATEGCGVEEDFPQLKQGTDEMDRGPFCALHDQYLSDRVADRDAGVVGAEPVTTERAQGAEQFGSASQAAATVALAGQPAAPQEPTSAQPGQPATALAQQPNAAPAWSDEDERAFQTLLARRPAARGRSREVAGQIVSLGSITPNPDTVVAVIVGLVAQRGGSVPRGDLLTAMAGAAFPHPKAKPSDRDWCQGYVAGAVRNGFLTASAEPAAAAEPAPVAAAC